MRIAKEWTSAADIWAAAQTFHASASETPFWYTQMRARRVYDFLRHIDVTERRAVILQWRGEPLPCRIVQRRAWQSTRVLVAPAGRDWRSPPSPLQFFASDLLAITPFEEPVREEEAQELDGWLTIERMIPTQRSVIPGLLGVTP